MRPPWSLVVADGSKTIENRSRATRITGEVLIHSSLRYNEKAVNPLRTFHAAISRQNEENQPSGGWYPNQRMTREEALESMTIWAARANFMERESGSISPGKHADFVVMDPDWLKAAPEAIMGARVVSLC